MSIKTTTLEASSPEQRRDYARNFLNLEIGPTDSDDAIRAKIAAAQPANPTIFYQEADTDAEQAAAETTPVELKPEEATGKISGSLGRGDPRAIIHIPVIETQDGSGTRDVVVGVNGRAWQLKRGHDLPVPWRVVEALKNAVANIVTHRTDEGHEGEVDERLASRIGFQIIRQPSPVEIDAWLERTGAEFCA